MDAKYSFDLKKARIFQAVKWSGCSVFSWGKLLRRIFTLLFLLFATLFLYGFFSQSFSQESNSALLGLALIFLSLSAGIRLKIAFFNQKLKNPEIPDNNNLAEHLSFAVAKAIYKSKSSTALLFKILKNNPQLRFVFSRLLLDLKEVKKNLKKQISRVQPYSNKEMQELIFEAFKIAKAKGHLRIGTGDMLTALARHEPNFKKILITNKLKASDINQATGWLESLEERIREKKKWWTYQNLMKKGTLAKEWTAGYTLTLDKYSTDWTEIGKKQGFPEIIGHKKEIGQIERILGRREHNNVLLVGQPGVGRKGIVQGLIRKAVLGQSLPDVNYKRVVELSLPGLLAEVVDPEQIEAILDKIFQEIVTSGNIILVINEFHNFVAVQSGPGRIDIAGVISSYLNLPQFQIVAVTSFAGLHKNIESNPSILNLFAKVEVSEISEKELTMVLGNLALALEQKYRLFVSYPALREIIALTKRFMSSLPFPKKALDVLDEVMIYVKKSTKDKVVLPSHVAKIITEKTQVPVGEIEVKEKEVLLNLEKLIHQRIINQDTAVKEISTALRRARAEVTVRQGPMGTFLFLGPTGVGKTETSKALAQTYFGSEAKMIRLDMSEFQAVKDITRLIGGKKQEGLLTTPVRESPFSLILLDEIEKAHPNILNLFLQVLDEGFLTDGLGRKINFKSSIIISTSNAGYQIILAALREKTNWSEVKQKLLDHIFEKGIFRPEFVNRFDAVVVFQPLTKKNLLAIAELMLRSLKKNLKEKGVEFKTTLSLKEKIVELGYDPTFGARAMRRVIQDKVENELASALLSGTLKRGDSVEINPSDFKLKIS